MKKGFITLKSSQLLFLLLLIVLFGSCVPQKKIRYLQSLAKEDTTSKSFVYSPVPDYKVQVGDNLYIKIQSFDDKTYRFFNPDAGNTNSNNMTNEASIYLNSYVVDRQGNISLPFIGAIYVKDHTLDVVKESIQNVIDQYLKETTVVVKMVSFKITMLGEVKVPGNYPIYQDRVNIFEAIARAGDLTNFANRNRVVLIRNGEKGALLHRIDLTKDDILSSDYFFLQPNDIVYVEPLRGKQFAFADFPYAILLSTISTSILIMQYFK